jgi:hypothetical protein
MLFLQEMDMGCQDSASRKFGTTVEGHQCIEFIEWQNTKDDFKEMTREVYQAEFKRTTTILFLCETACCDVRIIARELLQQLYILV